MNRILLKSHLILQKILWDCVPDLLPDTKTQDLTKDLNGETGFQIFFPALNIADNLPGYYEYTECQSKPLHLFQHPSINAR